MALSQAKARFLTPRILLLGLSFVSLVICVLSGAAHYRKAGWGDSWHPIGWLLSMAFLVFAFLPRQRDLMTGFKSLVKPKTAFFLFWILFFVVSHLWNFRTAPWNGDGLFDDSAVDLLYLKNYVIGHPFQPAWFHPYPLLISRETLFHYYVWGFLHFFGYNILSYEAALLVLWCGAFLFTLLLVDLFFGSYVVTSVVALIFNFLPFAFIYTFVGYRYPMTILCCVASVYFLHLGFRTASYFALSLSGIAAGICLASSIIGKQYLLALLIAAPLYSAFHRKSLMQGATWKSLAIVVYGFLAAAAPILLYIIFKRQDYTYYESTFLRDFWHAVRGDPAPHNVRYYVTQLWSCFFGIPGPRLFFPDVLPIPLPYYWLLVPGFTLALWQKRFEVVLLAILPAVGVFVSAGGTVEHRMLLAIPFWITLMAFAFAGLLRLKRWPGVQILLCAMAALLFLTGLGPSVRYIYGETQSPFMISYFEQPQVAVSRFLRHVVGGEDHPGSPRLERDEFNRITGLPDSPYDTLICPGEAYSVIHLFLHDYDDAKVLSLCGGSPMLVMTQQSVWSGNKKAIVDYVPIGKGLKVIWESGPTAEKIIEMLRPLHDLATEESISFSFAGTEKRFYVLNIASNDIREFQERVRTLPATPVQGTAETSSPQLRSLPEGVTNMFEGGRGTGKGQFDSPAGIAFDGSGNILVADTNNGRIEKFSPNGTFVTSVGTSGKGHRQFGAPNGLAVDRAGNIYVAEASNHRVQKLAADGTFIAEWKGPEPGFYGPRRIAIGPDNSIYVVDQGHNRVVRFNQDGTTLQTWGSSGSGDGQLNDPTSVAVDPTNNKVYVADPRNKRIQLFDSDGKFLTKWTVPEWGEPLGFEDLVMDSARKRLYASSAHMDSVLVFDLNGTRIASLTPKPPDKLAGPSALALTDRKLYVLNMAGNRVSQIDL